MKELKRLFPKLSDIENPDGITIRLTSYLKLEWANKAQIWCLYKKDKHGLFQPTRLEFSLDDIVSWMIKEGYNMGLLSVN